MFVETYTFKYCFDNAWVRYNRRIHEREIRSKAEIIITKKKKKIIRI